MINSNYEKNIYFACQLNPTGIIFLFIFLFKTWLNAQYNTFDDEIWVSAQHEQVNRIIMEPHPLYIFFSRVVAKTKYGYNNVLRRNIVYVKLHF